VITRLLVARRARRAAAWQRVRAKHAACHHCLSARRERVPCRLRPDGVPYRWHCVDERWCQFEYERLVQHAIAMGRPPRVTVLIRGCSVQAATHPDGRPMTTLDLANLPDD
jgi:hypothetical protein